MGYHDYSAKFGTARFDRSSFGYIIPSLSGEIPMRASISYPVYSADVSMPERNINIEVPNYNASISVPSYRVAVSVPDFEASTSASA